MEEWVKEIARKEKAARNIPIEVKKFGSSYYLYNSTTIWNKKESKAKKVSSYIGKITPKGLIEKGKTKHSISVYEFGAVKLLHNLVKEHLHENLQKFFYEYHGEIEALSMMKVLRSIAVSQASDYWEKLYLSSILEYNPQPSLSQNSISNMLKRIGSDMASQYSYFNHLTNGNKFLAFDLTSIFSRSENIRLAEKGYNHEHAYLNQINFLMLYSFDKKEPVMLKPLQGSIKDIKALKHEIGLFDGKDIIFVVDRGFASYELAKDMDKMKRSFIMPLKRNFNIINYSLKLDKMFAYRERGIKYGTLKTEFGNLHVFEDTKMRYEEESNFISKVENKEKSKREYAAASKRFGKIAILTNTYLDGKEIYVRYKEREGIEMAFDVMKNSLEFDKAYVHTTEGLYGYFFIAFNSILLYHKLMSMLRKNDMLNKISVDDLLLQLSKVSLIDFGHKRILSEIPKQVEDVVKTMGLKSENIFPKFLRS